MKRYFLSKKAIKGIAESFPFAGISKADSVEYVKDGEVEVVLLNGTVSFFYAERRLFPALRFVLGKENEFQKVTVDMGAVKFVCSGADVMRPGITQIDDGIKKDDIVVVTDEKNGKALAVGVALFCSDDMKNMKEGKAIRNIHRVGDRIWNFAG